MAAQILESISKDKKERVAYEEQLLAEMDAMSKLIYSKQQGIQQGIAESDEKWVAVVANKDVEIAKLQAELARLQAIHEPTA